MSTLTPPRPSLRGPVRVVVRQHRRILWIVGTLALAAVIALVGYTLWVSHFADGFEASACSGPGDTGRECDKAVGEYSDTMSDFSRWLVYVGVCLTFLPGIVSAFVAGPMIARELESGTCKVAWTQSVTPARWLTAKLAVPTVVMVAAVSVLSGVAAWARTQSPSDYATYWAAPEVFPSRGIVTVGYILLGIAVGTLVGLLVRRTVASIALAALVTGTVIVTLKDVRSGLWPLRTASGPDREAIRIPAEAWVVTDGRLTGSGERLPRDVCWRAGNLEDRCLAERDVTGWFYDYHPTSHFWPLQLVETGILLVLAAVALTLAFRVLRRRHG